MSLPGPVAADAPAVTPSARKRVAMAVLRTLVPACLAAGTASAAEPVPVLDRFALSIGLYDASNNLSGRWDSNRNELGTDFSFQRDLGFSDGDRLHYVNAAFGFGRERRFRLDLFRYEIDDDSHLTLTRDIRIGDDIYIAGADFNGKLDLSTRGASFTWFFRRTPRSATGLGLGVIDYKLDSLLEATVTVEGNSARLRHGIHEHEWAPVLHGEYVRTLGERWRMGASLLYLEATVGDVSGQVADAHARLEFFPREHVGIALRYSYSRVELDFRRTRHDGALDIHSRGPQLLATFRF